MSPSPDPMRLPPLVSADWLAANRAAVAVADARWYLDGRPALAEYEKGHIDGAVFVDMDTDLSDHSLPATMGRHPLPSPAAFAAAMSRLGIGDNTPVVAYDDSGGVTAGRLVVMLRSLGHSAALLDGGVAAWSGALVQGAPVARPSARFTERPWPADRFASLEEVGAIAARADTRTVLLDARAGDRYREIGRAHV